MINTTITAKLAAYFVSRKKFGDFGCYLMTPGVEKMLGLTPEEYNSPWRSAETLVLAMKQAYPETTQAGFDVYLFGEEGVDDEKVFEAWFERHKQTANGGRVIALFGVDKLKEKILLRGLLATHRAHQLHVIVFQEKWEGDIPPYIWQNSCNAEDINPTNPLMAIPSRPIPQPEPAQESDQVQQVAPEVATEEAAEPEPEFVQEVVQQNAEKNAEKGASQVSGKEQVTESVRPSIEKVVQEVVREVADEPVLKKAKNQGNQEGFQIADPDDSFAIEKAKRQTLEEIKAEVKEEQKPEAVQEAKIQLPIAKVPADQARRPDGTPVVKPTIKASPRNYIAQAYNQKQ